MRTSPLGSTSIQRGWSRPVAKALTLSPGAGVGFCPSLHPLAVGIFSVGTAPCGFAAGISGVLPQAATCGTPWIRRQVTATPPINATSRPKMLEIVMKLPWIVQRYIQGDTASITLNFQADWPRMPPFHYAKVTRNTYSSVETIDPSRGAGEQLGLFI